MHFDALQAAVNKQPTAASPHMKQRLARASAPAGAKQLRKSGQADKLTAQAGRKRSRNSGSIALDRPTRKRQPPPRWAQAPLERSFMQIHVRYKDNNMTLFMTSSFPSGAFWKYAGVR